MQIIDYYSGYRGIEDNYLRYVVIQSQNFVNPIMQAHTKQMKEIHLLEKQELKKDQEQIKNSVTTNWRNGETKRFH